MIERSVMSTSKLVSVGACLMIAGLISSPPAFGDEEAAAADQAVAPLADVLAKATVKWLTAPEASLGTAMRTSDFGATRKTCTTGQTGTECTARDSHNHTPKNIGNALCLDANMTNVEFEPSCAELLVEGQTQCDPNSLGSPSTYCSGIKVLPACNFRTPTEGDVEWNWTVQATREGYLVGCSQSGYVGVSPSNNEVSVVTGCLRHGRLLAVEPGAFPTRPCLPFEIEVRFPAEVGGFGDRSDRGRF